MAWQAQLQLAYERRAQRVVAVHQHSGPLRILQSLYPEGDGICHNVLVHPPGGLVGGDHLQLSVQTNPHTHGLLTTPGASRFYRCQAERAVQHTRLVLQNNSRLEWLPLETLCYNGCQAENRLEMQLQEGAELLGWDITALGLPLAHSPFVQGRLVQHLELPGIWLERACLDATDTVLLDGPLGLAGNRCIASLFFVTGSPLQRQRRQQALEVARSTIAAHSLARTAAVTSPNPHTIVVRALAPLVEPAMHLLRHIRSAWRQELWQLADCSPRIWAM